MITVRPAHERGHANHGWLDSYHTFSFANYFDRRYMGVSALRVINDDTVAPGAGFGTHGHRDMEIISYVLSGALEHKDSMGNGSIIRPGDVQRMSAGTGVTHSEYNASDDAAVNFLQIWIVPDKTGIAPGYEQKDFSAELRNRLRLVVSPDGREGSIRVQQDALLFASRLDPNARVVYQPSNSRTVYVHVAKGHVTLNDIDLRHGDGATLQTEDIINIAAIDDAEIILFDLP